MSKKENVVTFVNKQAIIKNGKEQKSFKDIVNMYKGGIATIVTFLATNKAAVFLGGVGQDSFIFWLGQQSIKYPALSGVIKVVGGVVSVAWNTLVANPALCSIIISALVACGATVVWGIKKAKLHHDIKKGNVIIGTKANAK